ncbi:glutaminase domain-containing protein [Lapidilactobacillus mulanensis]|uniref:Glutaminase domain-containing protein n=1 Tax=Lapidilactobacillus mulanensis TaxID=2485999 RepID=A0ABW4DMU4_9LACO|nr:DUF4965 domain-containing protein [Lapidilactobacillus mulanensis]
MTNNRIPSVPLVVHDPYFSIWSPADHLNDQETLSWTGKSMPINGLITIDDNIYNFLGRDERHENLKQQDCKITMTQTVVTFANEQVKLTVTFAQHFDLADLQSISEPITYLKLHVEVLDKIEHQINVQLKFDGHVTYESLTDNRLVTKELLVNDTQEVFIGKARQTPLNSSGDLINIDWGYLYLATNDEENKKVSAYQNWNEQGLQASFDLSTATKNDARLLIAYDDLQSINYFGHAQNAYWKEEQPSLSALLDLRLGEFEEILVDCNQIDEKIANQARKVGGDDYELICATAYRQAIAAHKLIKNENGDVVFLSKECNSNGCIGTVDVSYPSIPLFLAFQPKLIEGMLRPIYRFAKLPVWPFDYAPHDVGRYPYATGQVYGMNNSKQLDDSTAIREYDTVGMFYEFPASTDLYKHEYQMPVEECGDMIIMASTTSLLLHDGFLEENYEQLIKWSHFLIENGQDPDNQLCTDDFAGHLAHNVNLSLKAIVALGALGKALKETKYVAKGEELSQKAHEMALIWEQTAQSETDTRLAFDQADTWSLKYNLIWDEVLGLHLFSSTVAESEINRYLSELNEYGAPLDSRASYTKVDWLMWVASLTSGESALEPISKTVVKFLNETTDRQPFSDWYETKTGKMVAFKNRTVIGGVFMPLLKSLERYVK